MWLFDDILKRPDPSPTSQVNPPQGGGWQGSGQPPQDDSSTSGALPKFIIQKWIETTIFWSTTESERIAEENKGASEPLVHAEEDSGSIVVHTDVSIGNPNTTEAPEVLSEFLIESDQPMILDITSTEPKTETILGMNDFSIEKESSQDITPELRAIKSPLFWEENVFSDNVAPSIETSQSIAPIQEEVIENKLPFLPTVSTKDTPIDIFSTPKEFIEKSLQDLVLMLSKMKGRHDEKIAQAEGYGKEKEKFASLEANAYTQAHAIDEEKSHAIHMQKVFEKELRATDKKDEVTETDIGTIVKENHTSRAHVPLKRDTRHEKEATA